MAFVAGFIHDVETIAVTEFVDEWRVGIDGRAEEVDVALLHQLDVQFARSIVHMAAHAGMVVVAVDASELHVLSVNLQRLAHNLYVPHAQVIVEVLYRVALAVTQLDGQGIKVGLLCRP